MVYSGNRFRSANPKARTRPGRLPTLIGAVIFAGLAALLFVHTDGFGLLTQVNTRHELVDLWNQGDYRAVTEHAQRLLQQTPMQAYPLVFGGFGHFYYGMQQVDDELRFDHLDSAIRMLRKAHLVQQQPLHAESHYILAKAYYHLGEFYYDTAVEHMNRAIELGFVGPDSYEYLALAYDGLGMHGESIESYQQAIAARPVDLLYVGLADVLYRMERYGDAERYYRLALESSEDPHLMQRIRRQLGLALLAQQQFDQAGQEFRTILEENPRSADAHYYLGQVYLQSGDRERARFEWREAIRLDPRHEGALRSLRSN